MNIINLPTFSDIDGMLVPFSLKDVIDFIPKRVFYIKNVPKDEERGRHAHFKTIQFLICIQGEILIKTYDGKERKEYRLYPNQGVLIKNMIWDSQVFLTGMDILLVICSSEYDRSDYIEELCKFEEIVKNR